MIQKLDKNGNTSVDNANVVILDKNGNVKKIAAASGTVTSILTASPITGGPITSSGTIGITQATTSTDGYLSSTDWNTFNSKFNLPTLTSGSVLFSDGTTIAQKNSNFFWDNTNNRLGVGTNVPLFNLHVLGVGRFESSAGIGRAALNISGDFAFNTISQISQRANFYGYYTQNPNSSIGIGGNAQSNTSIQAFNYTNSSATTLSLQYYGGNVLIGSYTGSPNARLHITAPGALSTDIALRVRNSADTGDLMTMDGFGKLSINTTTNLASVSILSSGNASRLQFQSSAYNNIQANGVVPFYFDFNENLNFRGSVGATQIMRLVGATSNVLINTTTDNGGKLQIKAPGALSTDIALRVRNSADSADILNISGDHNVYVINNNNSAVFNVSNGTNYGLSIYGFQNAPVIGAFTSIGFGQYATSKTQGALTSYTMLLNVATKNVLINTTTDNGGKLQVKAPGALSTDIALRVRNSADTGDLMTVNGLGNSTLSATFTANNLVASQNVNFGNILYGTNFYSVSSGATTIGALAAANASAMLDVVSTTKGFLPPRMTNAQRIAIATPAVGLMVYCTDTVEGVYVNKSTGWTFIG